MSQTINCDGGCGLTSSNIKDFKVLGVAVEREYCAKCAPIVKEYIDDRNKLHSDLTKSWKLKSDKLRSKTRKLLPNGSLPDE